MYMNTAQVSHVTLTHPLSSSLSLNIESTAVIPG